MKLPKQSSLHFDEDEIVLRSLKDALEVILKSILDKNINPDYEIIDSIKKVICFYLPQKEVDNFLLEVSRKEDHYTRQRLGPYQ